MKQETAISVSRPCSLNDSGETTGKLKALLSELKPRGRMFADPGENGHFRNVHQIPPI